MRGWTRGARVLGVLTVAMTVGPSARGQSVGVGASPGRAAYRPIGQWNNGPYYTTPHVDPYAPHRAAATSLYAEEPLVPPWTTGPHGLYSPFYPGQGPLYSYDEGFSPYSGFAPWYARTYHVVATREVVQGARARFFRSAPLPPPGVLPPLPPARPLTLTIPAPPRRLEPTPAGVATPGPARSALPPGPIRVYRSSVAGG